MHDYEAKLATTEGLRWFRPVYASAMKEEAKKNLDDLSMHSLLHVLYNFPFVGITQYIDVYALFSVKRMHVYHLGVSRMLKDAAEELLSGTKHTKHN